ncbi:uncharacterized protein LOC132383917 isoform X1 [Hypanus sabinus]|uniref:uncharacterized protein LOC132383917 isoform X1 n=1 Tax=Hypanus sabinus TaxID=79690 RepID=UPI0028C4CA52|nr:uncharacterized protein LOC132383917 isoform X1 [Hypanus sabinus]
MLLLQSQFGLIMAVEEAMCGHISMGIRDRVGGYREALSIVTYSVGARRRSRRCRGGRTGSIGCNRRLQQTRSPHPRLSLPFCTSSRIKRQRQPPHIGADSHPPVFRLAIRFSRQPMEMLSIPILINIPLRALPI